MAVAPGLQEVCQKCGGRIPMKVEYGSCPPYARHYPDFANHTCLETPDPMGLEEARVVWLRSMGFDSEADYKEWKDGLRKRFADALKSV